MRQIGNDAEELLQLAHHAVQSGVGSHDKLQEFVASSRCDSAVICRSIAIAARDGNGLVPALSRQLLEAHLQTKLTTEHIAAQERMSSAADELQKAALKVSQSSKWLAAASVALAIVSLVLSIAELWK